ncbi:hypothetical protein HOE49_02530, partial [Candidatus Peregrinibacteria bacterium]|nr:hypothetical protein [Candidatus Peregrinibacteria bacterium]
MKNSNTNHSLFKEPRLVFVNSTEMKEMPHFNVESGEKIDEKIKRLDTVAKMMSKKESERIMKEKFAGSADLHIDPNNKRVLGLTEVDQMCGQMAKMIHPSDSMAQDLQHLDFIEALHENPAAGSEDTMTKKIQEEDEKFKGIVFHKAQDKNFIQIALIDKDGTPKEIGQFKVKSKKRTDLESKREIFLRKIREQRQGLDDEKKNILEMRKKVEAYRLQLINPPINLDPAQMKKEHKELIVGENPEQYTIIIGNIDPPGKTTKIILSYENGTYNYKVLGPNPVSKPGHTVKGKPSKKFTTPKFTKIKELVESTYEKEEPISLASMSGKEFVAKVEEKALYTDHTGTLFNANNTPAEPELKKQVDSQALKRATEKAEEKRQERMVEEEILAESAVKPIEEHLKKGPKTPTVAVKKIQDKIVKEIKLVKDPDTNLRTLTITTKKGTKLIYGEIKQRTPQMRAIWRYADTDEYYIDSGLRVDPKGSKYDGIGQKESVILGKHANIVRNTEQDIEEMSGAEVTMVKELSEKEKAMDRFLMSQGPKYVQDNLDLHMGLVKEKLDAKENNPVYSTLEGITQAISEHGKSMSQDLGKFYENITVDFHGVKVTWTKEHGYDNPENKDALLVKTSRMLQNYLSKKDYETFKERGKTLKTSARLTQAEELAEKQNRAHMLSKLTKTYKIKGFKDKHLFEGEMLDNWALFDGNKAVMRALQRFNVSSKHKIPKLAVKMITEWDNRRVDYKEVLKFAQPNLQGVFDPAIDAATLSTIMGKTVGLGYLLDPDNLAEFIKKGLVAAEKNEFHAEFMDKVFSSIVEPTIELLESLENLDFTKLEKEDTLETVENLILKMMRQGEETDSDFSLPAGNRFKLSEVSQFHNSENLEIGIDQKLVDQVTAGFRKRIMEGDLENKYIKYVDQIDNEMFLQALFLKISPETLVKEGCLKINAENQILLTKLPGKIKREPLYILDNVQSIVDGTLENYKGHYEWDEYGVGARVWVKHTDMDILRNKLPLIDRQTKAIKQLKDLCNGGDGRNWVKKIVDGCKGIKDFTYMTQLDGNTLFKHKSSLEEQMTSGAAFNYLMYHGEYYDVDTVRGFKTLNIAKLEEEVNKFIKLGALQMYLSKGGKKGAAPTQEEVTEQLKPGSEFNKRLKELEVRQLGLRGLGVGKLLKERKDAFQLGLLIEYNTKYEEQMDTIKMPKNPDMRKWIEWAISTEAEMSTIKTAISKFQAGIAVIAGGGDTSALFGAGCPIDLGGGFSLVVSAGVSGEGKVGGGLGLTYSFKAGNSTFTLGIAVAANVTGGVGLLLGGQNRHAYGNTAYEGIAIAGLLSHSS